MDKIKLTINGYNKIAKHWDGTRRHGWSEVNKYIDINILNFLKNKNEETYLEKIKKYFSFNNMNGVYSKELINILDLGCGNARIIDFLKEKDYFKNIKYIGIDPSIELINICKDRYTSNNKVNILNRNDNVEFKINDGINIPLADSSMDMIISLAVLHHVPREHQDEWLSEIHRVIKKDKNSRLILSVWIQNKEANKKNIEKDNSTGEENFKKEKINEVELAKRRSVHKKISENEMMMGFAQYENIRYVYLFTEDEPTKLLIKNKFRILEKHIDKRPNSEHKNLILILEPLY